MATWIGATPDYNNATNWAGGTPDALGETASFGTTGSAAVTVNSAVNPDSWTFSAAAKSFAISGAAVTLNSGLVNNAAVAQSIANIIAGVGGLQQNGAGTLTLAGKNTYTGATQVDVGTLRMGTGNAISTESAVTVAAGTTFDLNNTVQMIGSLAGAGNVTLGGGRLWTGYDDTSTTFSGVISGINGINKVGTGTFILSGHNTYSGSTQIDGGTLQLGANNALSPNMLVLGVGAGTTFNLAGFNQTLPLLGVSASGSVTLGSGILTLNSALTSFTFASTIQGVISGTGSLVKQGTNQLHLLADNTYTGTTTISGGLLRLGFLDSTAGSVAGDIINNAELEVSRSNTLILAGTISGSGTFRQNGTGGTILTADNTYTGGTTISAGTLVIGNGGSTGSIASSTLNNGGTLAFNHSNTLNFSTSIFGAGSVTQLGTGMTVLSGGNTYQGDTFLKAGTLDLAVAGAAGFGTIVFDAGSQTLRIESAAFSGSQFGNTIASFGAGDVIDLRGLAFASGATANYDVSSHVLTVTSGGISKTLTIDNPGTTAFTATNDGFGSTQVTLGGPPHWTATSDIGTHPAGWLPVSTADFNHDGTSDILWFNASNLNVDLWKISNAAWAGSVDIGSHPAGYNMAGAGDFNHDGAADLLWFNPASGDVDIWKLSNGGPWAGSVAVGAHPLGWQLLGSGEFNGDGTSDILWYNPSTNGAEVWMMQNGQWAGSVDIGTHPAGWQLGAAADLDNDGTTDIIWYNPATRDIDVWKIVDGHWAGSSNMGTHPAGYAPSRVADFNNDGWRDLLWFNPATGNADLWLLENGHWTASVDLGNHPLGWSPAGLGDFNHDGNLDILWRENTSTHVEAWLLSNS